MSAAIDSASGRRLQEVRPRNLLAECVRGAGPAAWVAVLGVVALLVVLRWNSLPVPLTRDEGEYAYAAQLLQRGLHPYEHAFIQKPPMMIYTYWLASMLAPGTFWFPRVLAAVCAAAVAGLLGLVARLEFGKGVALPAMWLVTPMLLSPGLWQFTANTEMFMIVPLWGVIALYAGSRHDSLGWWAWGLAGCLGATTVWYKYTALPVLVVLFAAWSFEEWRAKRRQVWRSWLLGLAGSAVASLIILAPFLIRDGGRRLWECTVQFNRYYHGSTGFGFGGLLSWLQDIWTDWWILFLLLGLLVVWPRRRAWFWIGMFLASLASTGGSPLGHYYIVVMPFWALLAALAIREVAAPVAKGVGKPEALVRAVAVAIAVLLLCLPDLPWITCRRQEFAVVKACGGNPVLESQAVARRVAELTSPDEPVYVAGSEPQILYYARRVSPTRFVIAYPMMLATPLAKPYQQEAIRELEQGPPALIVEARSPLSWLRQRGSPGDFFDYLNRLLAERYEAVGGWVGDGPQGRWEEPVPEQEREGCSLVLYRRKPAPQ